MFDTINAHLADKGLMHREGTIVDATIVAAPPSTKNRAKARDPEMRKTKKGNPWHFHMKAHIGTDADSALVGTSANVADVTAAHALLHGQERDVFADTGYEGVHKRADNRRSPVSWHIAMKAGKRKALSATANGRLREQLEQANARIRARAEHPFHVIKNLVGHRTTRHRGLTRKTAQLHTLCALANLVMAR